MIIYFQILIIFVCETKIVQIFIIIGLNNDSFEFLVYIV